jgi:hypothetical protein
MSSEAMREVLQLIDAKTRSRPTPMEFELAYQARVAVDRIRFAIKHTEQFAPQTDPMQEVGLQLLDALQRLETADRRFQEQSRSGSEPRNGNGERAFESTAGSPKKVASSGLTNGINGRSVGETKDRSRE